jgi:hypothetical protein
MGERLEAAGAAWADGTGRWLSTDGHIIFLCPQAVNDSGIVLPCPVRDIMDRWILQMGFPVITVDTDSGRISQEHFLLDSEANVTRPSEFG